MEILNKSNYESVITANSDKIIAVDFYADWCGPCKVLGPTLESMVSENTDVLFVKVNIDNSPELAKEHNIRSVPTVLLFKGDSVVGSILGNQPKQAIQNKINVLKS